MIYYEPTSGDPSTSPIPSNPKTCFLMTQLGGELHPDLVDMRGVVEAALVRHDFKLIDANSRVTGRDFLLKIWQLVISVPVGIAFGLMADQLEKNPVLSIDFLRRAYLVSGDSSFRQRALEIFDSAGLAVRAKNSVEALLAQF